MKKIKVGLIGLGTMGKIYLKHLSNDLNSEVEIRAICDIHIDETLLKNNFIPLVTRDYKQILDCKDIEAIIIASSSQTHVPILIDFLQSNKKVFCENPISMDRESLIKLLAVIKKEKGFLQMSCHRQFDNNYKTLRQKCKRLGKIRNIHIITRQPTIPTRKEIQYNGDIFISKVNHDFDLLYFLSNQEIQSMQVQGFSKNKDLANLTPDHIILNMQLSQKTLCTVINSYYCSYGYDQRVEVFGDKGMIYLNNNYSDEVFFLGKEGLKKQNFHQNFIEMDKKSYLEEMKDFISNVRDNKFFTLKNELKVITSSLMAKKSFHEKRVVYYQEIQEEMKNIAC